MIKLTAKLTKDTEKNEAADILAELRKADELMRDRLFVLQVSIDTFQSKSFEIQTIELFILNCCRCFRCGANTTRKRRINLLEERMVSFWIQILQRFWRTKKRELIEQNVNN
jgi:hypothetical protein